MWLLVSTVCILTSPVHVECSTEASGPHRTLNNCRAMVGATETYVKEQAETVGAEVVFAAAACRFGDVI